MRLILTLPWDGNSNQAVAVALTRQRDRCKPVERSAVDTQVVGGRIFERLNIHSRMDLALRVCTEVAAMRGWTRNDHV